MSPNHLGKPCLTLYLLFSAASLNIKQFLPQLCHAPGSNKGSDVAHVRSKKVCFTKPGKGQKKWLPIGSVVKLLEKKPGMYAEIASQDSLLNGTASPLPHLSPSGAILVSLSWVFPFPSTLSAWPRPPHSDPTSSKFKFRAWGPPFPLLSSYPPPPYFVPHPLHLPSPTSMIAWCCLDVWSLIHFSDYQEYRELSPAFFFVFQFYPSCLAPASHA